MGDEQKQGYFVFVVGPTITHTPMAEHLERGRREDLHNRFYFANHETDTAR